MQTYYYLAANVIAILLLVFAVYLPRHRRHHMVVAYVVVNLGVMAVASVLSSSTVAAGLGLGLFGVLSIIRLRSEELSQIEVAYYFVSLALGLLGGLGASVGNWLPVIFMAVLIGGVALLDSRLFNTSESRLIVLDQAIANDENLRVRLEQVTGRAVEQATVLRLDLVNDSTMVRAKLGPVVSSEISFDLANVR